MQLSVSFFADSILLGAGLAMDAFSVSIVNTIAEPFMKKRKMAGVAGTYAFFQFAMPMAGWFCVHEVAEKFKSFQKFIPYIALVLLLYIGGKMLIEGIRKKSSKEAEDEEEKDSGKVLTFGALFVQGVATSIDALSVGFTIADYSAGGALLSSGIIAAVTFIICMTGLLIGKRIGVKISDKASIVGGVILIFIGLEIFIRGII